MAPDAEPHGWCCRRRHHPPPTCIISPQLTSTNEFLALPAGMSQHLGPAALGPQLLAASLMQDAGLRYPGVLQLQVSAPPNTYRMLFVR